MQKNKLYILVFIILLVTFAYNIQKKETKLVTPKEKYSVLIADKDSERITGLSNKQTLDENTVMLFVFERSDYHGIWMKDMLFPIDIVFLDEEYNVINYFDNVTPASYPNIYYPERPAKYVVEMVAGQRINSGIDKNIKVYYK